MGVSRHALAAVLLYENQRQFLETKLGKAAWVVAWLLPRELGGEEYASVGIAQLEIYKARALMNDKKLSKHFTDAERNMTFKAIAAKLMNDPGYAIKMAAARLAYVKDNYRVTGDNGRPRKLTDWEATIAYCGCAGNERTFRKWADSGYQFRYAPDRNTNGYNGAQKRYDTMFGRNGFRDRANEYWRCIEAYCWWME